MFGRLINGCYFPFQSRGGPHFDERIGAWVNAPSEIDHSATMPPQVDSVFSPNVRWVLVGLSAIDFFTNFQTVFVIHPAAPLGSFALALISVIVPFILAIVGCRELTGGGMVTMVRRPRRRYLIWILACEGLLVEEEDGWWQGWAANRKVIYRSSGLVFRSASSLYAQAVALSYMSAVINSDGPIAGEGGRDGLAMDMALIAQAVFFSSVDCFRRLYFLLWPLLRSSSPVFPVTETDEHVEAAATRELDDIVERERGS
mmetsp:Transcript_73654/g.195929  ORF Transcript_73654/g.195929 Transcript_73654/m.195929 type:complete len:258 (-) Transcript_73654:779-1552(-)